jgi:hypothetical protein
MKPRSRDDIRPRFASSIALSKVRAQGRPGGRCTRGSRAKRICASAKTTGTGGDRTGLPCAMGYDLYVLLGEPPRLPPSPHAHLAQSLAPDLGAPGPHDFVVRKESRSSVSPFTSTASPASRLVTFAIRPLHRGGIARINTDFQKFASGMFLCAGLEQASALDSARQISICAHTNSLKTKGHAGRVENPKAK